MLRRTVLTLQGAQFTAHAFTSTLEEAQIRISMDGKGRALDNVFIERLWRTVKYEDIYLRDYATVPMLYAGLDSYFRFYNDERSHQSLNYATPAEVHFAGSGQSFSTKSAALQDSPVLTGVKGFASRPNCRPTLDPCCAPGWESVAAAWPEKRA